MVSGPFLMFRNETVFSVAMGYCRPYGDYTIVLGKKLSGTRGLSVKIIKRIHRFFVILMVSAVINPHYPQREEINWTECAYKDAQNLQKDGKKE